MRRFRKWLSIKFFRFSIWLLPVVPSKTREAQINELIIKVTQLERFKKLIPYATQANASDAYHPSKHGSIEYDIHPSGRPSSPSYPHKQTK